MKKTAWNIGGVLALWGAGLCAWAQPAPTASIYTCVDAKGRKLTADRPIADCTDREQRVLGPTGTERQRVGPTLTEQERSALEAQRRKEAEERARVADERRRERALMTRYPDKATHDAERAQALEQVDQITVVAERRIVELQDQRKKLNTEMEFYKRDPNKAPMNLRRMLAENEDAIAEQQRFVAGQDQEKRRVNQRFDAELAQLRQLWATRTAAPLAAPAATEQGAKP
ncbi:MAG: DUF4124 domain-containing protein [Acidovorax sp.]|nr:DUF4124 domain-containing protein [Acidovorax sp.]